MGLRPSFPVVVAVQRCLPNAGTFRGFVLVLFSGLFISEGPGSWILKDLQNCQNLVDFVLVHVIYFG